MKCLINDVELKGFVSLEVTEEIIAINYESNSNYISNRRKAIKQQLSELENKVLELGNTSPDEQIIIKYMFEQLDIII